MNAIGLRSILKVEPVVVIPSVGPRVEEASYSGTRKTEKAEKSFVGIFEDACNRKK